MTLGQGGLAALSFRGTWRKYQQMVLDLVERQLERPDDDRKYHIVAPPGSGKTVVGLELIRRWGRPAVVFAPTTTIQQQWIEKLELFGADQAWVREHASADPRQLADITVLTYQSLSTPGENLAFVEEAAVERWVDDLLRAGREADEVSARARITALRQANRASFRGEVSRRYRRVKRDLLRTGGVDARRLLHGNARDLIDRLVALNVGTVVLDECHHLLDYWAFILRELLRRLPDVRVVGLTATLPTPEDESEYDNYAALLGDVDFEVPTPAVVKEGNLAPYRDLVYFCEPSKREQDYLARIQAHFESAVEHVTSGDAFRSWVWATVVERPLVATDSSRGVPAPTQEPFAQFFDREPLLCIAGVRFLRSRGAALPPDLPLTEEMEGQPRLDDWLVLLEAYALGILKLSASERDHEALRDLRQALLPFGITVTESGIRHGRSPGDLVLALSESKDSATVAILGAEAEAMGESLRALVITDYERLSATSRRLSDVLDADAGSAVRVFRRLLADPVTCALAPVLVTGKTVLVSSEHADSIVGELRRLAAGNGDEWTCECRPTDDGGIRQVLGSGPGWSTRAYVSAITALFDHGSVRCLVGTRGIFGEGWDSLRLNTLVDLTAVTTSTGVQQIRGRTIRLDPQWPRKVAHNWDVICVGRRYEKGDADLRRLLVRHAHTWGIVVPARSADLRDAVRAVVAGAEPTLPSAGRVVRGIAHVDMRLARELSWQDFRRVDFAGYSRRALQATRERERVYDLWHVGEQYSNFSFSATEIQKEDLKFRTVYTVAESLKAMLWRLGASLLGVALGVWLNLMLYARGAGDMLAFIVLLVTVIAVATSLVVHARAIVQAFRRTFLELPADAVLLDMGRALLAGLRDAGIVSTRLSDEYVRVVETESGGFEVFVDYASPEDANAFSVAYRQMMGPVGDARYLIERDSGSMRNLIYRPLWAGVRRLLGLTEDLRAYHRVPDALASRKERAEAFARHWQRYVGGGRLVYTRNAEGRHTLLRARARQRRKVRQIAFEVWR